MHNIKEIRSDIQGFKKLMKKRFLDFDVDKILKLDENNRKFIQEKESLEKKKKDISKLNDKKLFEKSKSFSIEIEKIGKLQSDIKSELEGLLSSIPNIPHNDVPIGKDENSNVEISKNGIIPKFNFKPKSHFELGENLNMLDFESVCFDMALH